MEKYKVKISCPGFIIGDEIESNFGVTEINGLKISLHKYPEIFERIKESLFTTFDGVEIFDKNTILWDVNKYSFTIDESKYSEVDTSVKSFLYFSTQKAAEEWVKENEPVFSKKQILDALENSKIDDDRVINVSIFKELVGL